MVAVRILRNHQRIKRSFGGLGHSLSKSRDCSEDLRTRPGAGPRELGVATPCPHSGSPVGGQTINKELCVVGAQQIFVEHVAKIDVR